MIAPIVMSLVLGFAMAAEAPMASAPVEKAKRRVTSVYLSQTFINEQLQTKMKPGLLRDLSVELDDKGKQILLRGLFQVPIDELRAVNLDPSLGSYRFQVTIKPQTTKEGYLILEFPLNETYFYPSSSKNPKRDRVFVPVQMLSIALASARGYFAALSGDFSSFDRKTAKLQALIKSLDRSIAVEKNADAKESMKTERDSLKLQLAAVPLERKQLKRMSDRVASLLALTGKNDMNLNDQFSAQQNAIVLKLNMANFTPYLTGVELGGIRILHDKRDGPKGENYFSVDINAEIEAPEPIPPRKKRAGGQTGMKTPPSAMIRINQALFESDAVQKAQKEKLGSKVSDLNISMQEDGVHVVGRYKKFFFSIPFDATVDFDSMDPDVFEVSVRGIEVAGLDLGFLSGFVLESVKDRLEESLKGMCAFEYIGKKEDDSRALQVTVNTKKMIPALEGMHVLDVDVRDHEFLFKIGKVD